MSLIHVISPMISSNNESVTLFKNAALTQLFFNHTPASLAVFDGEMRYVAVSQRWRTDYGLGDLELIGRSHYDIFPEISENWKNVHRRCLAGEVIRSDEERFVRENGTVHWLRWEVMPWLDGEGHIGGIVIFSEDITVRKQVEADSFSAQIQLAATLDALPDLLFELSLSGKYNDCRAGRSELLAAPQDRLLGRTVQDMLPPDAAKIVMLGISEAHRTGRSHGKQIQLQVPEGLLWFELSIAKKLIAANLEPQFVVLSRDITARKLAENQLKQSCAELEKLTTRLEVVREREQQRIARELHDEMGSVLAALKINASLLARKIPAGMEDVLADVMNLTKLIDQGISGARRVVKALRPTQLDQVGLFNTIEIYVQEFERSTQIRCSLAFSDTEPMLDENLSAAIFRMIQESLTNVARHAQASHVMVTLKVLDLLVALTVVDNGKGFDPSQHRGCSFGLIGIRERAAMLGGEAKITSAPNQGTTVQVDIPLNSL